MAVLLEKYPENISVVEEPFRNDIENLTRWTGEILTKRQINPGVRISIPDERLYLYQAQNEGKPVFFFSNQNRDKSIAFDAEFETAGLYPWKWDAESGEKTIYSLNTKNVGIHLKPLESLLLVFLEEKGEITNSQSLITTTEIDLNEN